MLFHSANFSQECIKYITPYTPTPNGSFMWLLLIGYPLITLFGLIGNIISAYLLNPFGTKISGHVYLACLAVFDSLSLVFYMISLWNVLVLAQHLFTVKKYSAVAWILRYFSTRGICEIRIYFTFMTRMLSVWTVVLLTNERFLMIISPLRFYKFLRPKFAWKVMGGMTAIVVVINVPWLFSFKYVLRPDCTDGKPTGSTHNFCLPNHLFPICRFIEFLFITVFPGVFLFVANTTIAVTLARRRRLWLQVSAESTPSQQSPLVAVDTSFQWHTVTALPEDSLAANSHRAARRVEQTLTLRLFLVSLTFLLLSMPSMVFVSMVSYAEYRRHKYHLSGWLADAFHVSLFLFAINLAINFVIYCVTGSTFRRAFWALVTCQYRLASRLRWALYSGSTSDVSLVANPLGSSQPALEVGKRSSLVEIGTRLKEQPTG